MRATTITTATLLGSQGTGGTKNRKADLNASLKSICQNPHRSNFIETHDDSLTKSKIARASSNWPVSDHDIKKGRQQARRADRKEKKEAMGVCDFSNDD